MANENLGAAKVAKNDEFYTRYSDIEVEMNAYLSYNPDVFRGKTILLPCDDPEWSNFTKYFAQRFQDLGIKKLVSTSFAANSKPKEIPYQPTLLELDNPSFDRDKTRSNGKIFSLTRDRTGDGTINVHDLEWSYLQGNGDFRSPEITALRDEADMIITNPPFSLFSEFVGWLVEGNTRFSIIGNANASTYKEIFPLLKANKMWLGVTRTGVGSMYFYVFEGAPERTGQIIDENGRRMQTIGNSAWFTNIDHGRRHEPLQLMTMEENLRFNKAVKDTGYKKYDNYNALEVPKVDAIPSDYSEVMGVPISFLGKYNPDQFEIVGASDNGAVANEYKLPHIKKHNEPFVAGAKVYKRIFIRHRVSDEN